VLASNQIKALISLLDDPEQEVWETAIKELSNASFSQITELNSYMDELTETAEQRNRLEKCIQQIQFQHTGNLLADWKKTGGKNLLQAMSYICQLRYPEVTEISLAEKLEALRLDAWLEFHYDLTSFEKVKILNYILFQLHGFRGDEVNYLHHDNSYLNKVLENKKGNPISLSIMYMLVAQRLNVPVYGVNLPHHFIMAYVEDEETASLANFGDKQMISHKAHGEIKFYINAYNGGGVFNLEQLRSILTEMELEEKPEFIQPCTNEDIVLRVLMNLYNSYSSENKYEAELVDKVIEQFRTV
jgi:regulator of sirC expression with transglutaminase-like and TPR domain